MVTFRYGCDSGSGSVKANDIHEAVAKLDTKFGVTDTLGDGSWLWVESPDGSREYLEEITEKN